MNMQTTFATAFDAALQAYESTLAATHEPNIVEDSEMDRRLDHNMVALRGLTLAEASTVKELGEKLRVLRALVFDEGGGHPMIEFEQAAHDYPAEKGALDLLESICRDVTAIAPTADRGGLQVQNMEAFDRMTLRVPFIASSLRTLRLAIEFGENNVPQYLLDSVGAILILADDAKNALDEAFDADSAVTP